MSNKQLVAAGGAADNEVDYDDAAKRNDNPFQPKGLYMRYFCSVR